VCTNVVGCSINPHVPKGRPLPRKSERAPFSFPPAGFAKDRAVVGYTPSTDTIERRYWEATPQTFSLHLVPGQNQRPFFRETLISSLQIGATLMKKYILAAALIGAFAAPASAASFYVMFNKATKTCEIARTAPSETEKFSMMGIYGSEANAKMAMAGMMKCRG
jgi:hypothetical protein